MKKMIFLLVFLVIYEGNGLANEKESHHWVVCDYHAAHLPLLTQAVVCKDMPQIKYLLEKGEDVNCRDNMDHTPLVWATTSYADKKIAEFLLLHGADPNLTIHSGITVLMMVASEPYDYSVGLIRLLVLYNGNVYAKDDKGRLPIDYVKKEDRNRLEKRDFFDQK